MLERLEFTLSRLLRMFFTDCRRLFNFSLYYLLISTALNVLVHLVIYYITWRFFLSDTPWKEGFSSGLFSNSVLWASVNQSFHLILLVTIFPYVLFLRHISLNDSSHTSLVRVFNKEILSRTWQKVTLVSFAAATIYLIINLLTWGNLQDSTTHDIFFGSEVSGDEPVRYLERTLSWLNGLWTDVLPLFFLLIPFALLLREDYVLDKDTLKQFHLAIITVIIMGYILNALTNDVSYLIDTVAGDLFKIPFRDEVGGRILLLAMRLTVIAYVLPLSAGMIVYPYEFELLQEPETPAEDAEPLPGLE